MDHQVGGADGLRFSHLEIPQPFTKHEGSPKGLCLAANILLRWKYCRKVVTQPHPWWQAENRAWDAGRQRHDRTATYWSIQTAQLATPQHSPRNRISRGLHAHWEK